MTYTAMFTKLSGKDNCGFFIFNQLTSLPEITMKIGHLVKMTGIPKQTIHFYMREGLLRKPRKSSVNNAEYTESHLEQLLLIKDLRDNFFLPIPEIKKILKNRKRQSPLDQAMVHRRSKYFRPMDQLLNIEIQGRDRFLKATGMSEKWLEKMESWGVISPRMEGEEPVYSHDDLNIGRLISDMDDLGFGPVNGYDPGDLKMVTDFIREYIQSADNRYLANNQKKFTSEEHMEECRQFIEVMSLFFYHSYRRVVREKYYMIVNNKESNPADSQP